jgi:hypothetical protein
VVVLITDGEPADSKARIRTNNDELDRALDLKADESVARVFGQTTFGGRSRHRPAGAAADVVCRVRSLRLGPIPGRGIAAKCRQPW